MIPSARAPADATKPYLRLVEFTEHCLEQYGDTYQGVGWTISEEAARRRYQVMLEVIDSDPGEPVSLLDFGCGASHLLAYLRERGWDDRIRYSGLDLSSKFLELSRRKFPEIRYYQLDLLDERAGLPKFDYMVLNGIFTYRDDLSFEMMLEYFHALAARAFEHVERGLAFNVQSPLAPSRDYLFHLPFQTLAEFVTDQLSDRFVIRNDYGLLDYTVYVYR
jgi:SAM-dependent methyltransferase